MKKYLIIIALIIFTWSLLSGNSITKKDNLGLLTKMNTQRFSVDGNESDEEKFYKVDKALGIVHPIFAGIAYTGFLALDGIGIALSVLSFTNPNSQYYNPLHTAHIAVAIPALLSFSTLIGIGFTKVGLKIKNGYKVRKAHFVASFVTLGFYVLEVVSLILSAVFFSNDLENKEWVGLSHGIVCSLSTVAFAASFITIFL